MRIFLMLVLQTLLISGCATKWTKDNYIEQEFHRDKGECLAQCGQASGAQGCTYATEHIYDSCMMGKGWRKADQF